MSIEDNKEVFPVIDANFARYLGDRKFSRVSQSYVFTLIQAVALSGGTEIPFILDETELPTFKEEVLPKLNGLGYTVVKIPNQGHASDVYVVAWAR